MAIAIAWQTAKGRRTAADRWTPVILSGLTLAGEAAMLGVLATIFRDKYRGRIPLYPSLHLAALVVRVALLFFLNFSFTPFMQRVTFKSPAATAANGSSYGTFGNGKPADGAPGPSTSAAPPPASASFRVLLDRVRVLSPYLWPRKSFALQCVAIACFSILVVGRVINPLVPARLGAIVEDLRLQKGPTPTLGSLIYADLERSALDQPGRIHRSALPTGLGRHPQCLAEQPLDPSAPAAPPPA